MVGLCFRRPIFAGLRWCCTRFWRGMIDPMLEAAPGLTIYMPDLRGFNQSSRPANMSAYSIDRLVDDAANLLNLVSPGMPAEVGHKLCH